MIKSFSQYLAEEAPKEITFAFGRFNPPTVGHEKLLDKVASIAKGKVYRVYASASEDPKKNPLSSEAKVKFMRAMFPRHARAILTDSGVSSVLTACVKFYDQGFTEVILVAGSDRVTEFETLLNKYNGVKMREGFYNFKNGVKVVSAGDRDPDAEGVSGMSASKMRNAASANDLETFSKGLPSSYRGAEELFNAVRSGMGLKESHSFRKHIQLEAVSDRREMYVAGELFEPGDQVVIKESEEVGKIATCGSNYLIVELHDGRKVRKWLTAVELVEKKEPVTEQFIEKIKPQIYPKPVGIPLSVLRSR